ncbi:hypothetical protein Y032_0011g1544 [Ancylostoma ceylanicum]|uniref:Uncharacterized protein n=1 Tax=Ancylostoma ceylanicum TaxID=53326 RepID=A0A016VGF0_9BILA|nr:hypothetical protein Y032_0011g1544 [Ancylostoma ceylanicum]
MSHGKSPLFFIVGGEDLDRIKFKDGGFDLRQNTIWVLFIYIASERQVSMAHVFIMICAAISFKCVGRAPQFFQL